jgi:hypothetical protein
MGILIAIFLAVLVICAAFWSYEKVRTSKLQKVADKLGMEFYKKGTPSRYFDKLGSRGIYQENHSKRAKNVMRKRLEDGAFLTLLDYSFSAQITITKSRRFACTVFVLDDLGMTLPRFELWHSTFNDRPGIGFRGGTEVILEENIRFTQEYTLHTSGQDKEKVKALFTKQLIGFFTYHNHYSVQADGHKIMIQRAGYREGAHEIEEFIEQSLQIRDMLLSDHHVDA